MSSTKETVMNMARRQRGITLVESLVAMAVSAVTVGSVAPAFQRAHEQRRLEGAAAQIETEMQYARSLAITRNASIRVTFRPYASESCYVIHTGPANACQCGSSGSRCAPGAEEIRTHVFGAESRLSATSSSKSFLFDATHGTVTPTSTIELRGSGGQSLRLVINITGRIRACSPTGVTGYRAC